MRRKNHHILIIDDDPNIRMLLEFVLRKQYQIATRADALSALSWMSMGNIPDLIIVDMEMPRLNGYEFLKNVRGSGFFREIPIVMLSAHESDSVRTKVLQAGANDYLVKPFNPEDIQNRIAKIISLKDKLGQM